MNNKYIVRALAHRGLDSEHYAYWEYTTLANAEKWAKILGGKIVKHAFEPDEDIGGQTEKAIEAWREEKNQ